MLIFYILVSSKIKNFTIDFHYLWQEKVLIKIGSNIIPF